MDVQKDRTFTHFPADPTRSGHVPRTLLVGKEAGGWLEAGSAWAGGSDASICFTWKGNLFLEHVQMGPLPGLFAGPPVVLLMLAQRAVDVLDPLKQFASHRRGVRFHVLRVLQVASRLLVCGCRVAKRCIREGCRDEDFEG